jgi:hypothetical protein
MRDVLIYNVGEKLKKRNGEMAGTSYNNISFIYIFI